MQIGVGLYWRKTKDLWVNFAPVTGRLILVNKDFTQNLAEGKTYFGVKKGKNNRFELGASLSSYFKVQLLENVELENRLSLYSDYLENPGNIDLDYTGITTVINSKTYNLGMTFTQGVAPPEVNPYSGEIVYVDNRASITRSSNQKEDIKIIVEF